MDMDGYEVWANVFRKPKYIAAPMVDMSELPFRMLCRRYGTQVCYSPMFNASQFVEEEKYRQSNFKTCPEDRPLIVQFCANDPDTFVKAARLVEDDCDAVDLNLGCPQVIAKRGKFGSYLQEHWDTVCEIVSMATKDLKIPVTCKIRILKNREETILHAKRLQEAGCKILTVHGRNRDQKGIHTGLADWDTIKAVKDALSIPVIANGNILNFADVQKCLSYTGVDAVMSAEGLLHNPALFSGKDVPVWQIANEFLQLCSIYPIPHGHVKTHFFRLFAYCLPRFKNLQERLSTASSVAEIKEICADLKDSLQCLQNEEETSSNKVTEYVLPFHTSLITGESIENAMVTETCSQKSSDTENNMDISSKSAHMSSKAPNIESENMAKGEGSFENTAINDNESKYDNDKDMDTCENGKDSQYIKPIWICHSRPRKNKNQDVKERKHLTKSEKKILRYERKLEGHRLRRKRLKEEKREMAGKRSRRETDSSDIDEGRITKKQKMKMIKEKLQESLKTGQRIFIDCSMEKLMTDKENSKLAQQLGRVYGSNRGAAKPMCLYFGNLNQDGHLYSECIRKNDGFKDYLVNITDKSYTEIFEKDEIVYLSPDSPNVIQTLDPNKVYILGGLVDESIIKNTTTQKATENKISTARLPIQEYMEKTVPNGNTVLAINQVFDILLYFAESGDWRQALPMGVPKRKGYELKKEQQ